MYLANRHGWKGPAAEDEEEENNDNTTPATPVDPHTYPQGPAKPIISSISSSNGIAPVSDINCDLNDANDWEEFWSNLKHNDWDWEGSGNSLYNYMHTRPNRKAKSSEENISWSNQDVIAHCNKIDEHDGIDQNKKKCETKLCRKLMLETYADDEEQQEHGNGPRKRRRGASQQFVS